MSHSPPPPPAQAPGLLARRAERMNPSVIREILKVTERPASSASPVACRRPRPFRSSRVRPRLRQVLRDDAQAALQYAASEGYRPLVEMVATACPGMSTRPAC
jgi:2-aminoadipate transaminase